MVTKKEARQPLTNNEIRTLMLQYFYDRNRNATSSRGKKGSSVKISDVKRELKAIDIRISQWGEYFDDVMEHPSKYGIENTKDQCAGRAIFKEDATPCRNPSAFYFYHAGHPSTAVHKAVGAMLFEELAHSVKTEKGRRE